MHVEPRHLLARHSEEEAREDRPEQQEAREHVHPQGEHAKEDDAEWRPDVEERSLLDLGRVREEQQHDNQSDRAANDQQMVHSPADGVVQPRRDRERQRQELVHRDRHEVVVLRLIAAGDGLLADPVVHRTPHPREEARRVREERREQQDVGHPEARGGDQPRLRLPQEPEDSRDADEEHDRRHRDARLLAGDV